MIPMVNQMHFAHLTAHNRPRRRHGGVYRHWFTILALLFLFLSATLSPTTTLFAQQEGVWAGVVTDREGNPQAALVSINGVSIQTDESGKFELLAPIGEEARNVVNAEASGYGLTSIIIKSDAPIQDLRIQINPAQVNIFEPGQFIEVKDERGTVVTIEPDALVDEAGNPPQSPLQVQLYTYAILEGEIIGDQSAIAIDGEEVQLRTFGMIDIQIVDDKGQRYNLRPGAIATISMPVLDVENDPDTVGLWDFDTNRGLWIEEEGVARREGDRFVGQTPRLGGKNLDIRRPALPTPLTCQANEVLTVLRAGAVDAFASGPDVPPAMPNSALIAHLNTANPAAPILGFDEPITNWDYWFAHSFNLTGLAPNITAAMLEFAARPSQSWLANNDTAWVGFTNTAIWSSALGAGVGLPWTNANYPAGQLFRTPAFTGSNVVAMNSNQFLDFVVQDDSAVDYVTLALCIKQPPPDADLGDAPGPNPLGASMLAYPGVVAQFPVVYNNPGATALGPIHWAAKKDAWLGKDVSGEKDAHLLPDADLLTNIDPTANLANRDRFDDGIRSGTLNLPNCATTTFQYDLSVVGAKKNRYVNVWFDFNRNGKWGETLKCKDKTGINRTVKEWAIVNRASSLSPRATPYTLATPAFWAVNPPTAGNPLWMRITLSESQAATTQVDGRGLSGGYQYGETEDYLLTGPFVMAATMGAEAIEWSTMTEAEVEALTTTTNAIDDNQIDTEADALAEVQDEERVMDKRVYLPLLRK